MGKQKQLDMEEKIDLFGMDLEQKQSTNPMKNETKEDISVVCEAIQLIRIVKSVMTTRREIIDTIKIDGAKMTYERAMRVAKSKAQVIGNCMVVEKLERVVVVF